MATRHSLSRRRRRLLPAALAALAAAAPLEAQQRPEGGQSSGYISRGDLTALIARLERADRSPAYSEGLRARARAEADRARSRLENGDFQLGNRILLVVQGEPALTDTFTVGQGQEISLPLIGAISLRGVLHAELERHLSAQLARRIRDPVVQARPMLRVAIEGAVVRPGFYSVPAAALLGETLMAAGGLAPGARVGEAKLDRSGREVLSASAFRQAVTMGRTLDQLDVRAGDRIMVPQGGGGFAETEAWLRTVTTLLSIPLTVFALTQVF